MSERQPTSTVSVKALDALASLQQLSLETGLSENRKQLAFRMVNHTRRFLPYDRAALWDMQDSRPRLLGVSGADDVPHRSPLVDEWRSLITALPSPENVQHIGPEIVTDETATWHTLADRTDGLSVLWVPIRIEDRLVAGLWLERWGNARFDESDIARVEPLALSYGVAWRAVCGAPGRWRTTLRSRRGAMTATALALLITVLTFVEVPLRIVAPCQVVPDEPLAVTAPLDGVIDDVPVEPGRQVEPGSVLAVYDQRVAREELEVARQQVEIVASDLQRARVEAFDDPKKRTRIALLENRLKQEQVRLRIAEERVARLEVRAPAAGTLMLADPNEWRGRPVQVGERLMMLVDPARTKICIWLPEDDRIEFNLDRPARVILDAAPARSHAATLRYLANHSQTSPDGVPSFRAEADWTNPTADARLGQKGTAVLWGKRVPLGYWLLRRPIAAVRSFVGI